MLFMENSFYKQTTSQSCLIVCLFTLSGLNLTRKEETNILLKSWESDRENYALAVSELFADKYGKKIVITTHFKYYSRILKKTRRSSRIKVNNVKINEAVLVKNLPCAVYLDYYRLFAVVRGPHFVVLESLRDNRFSVIDPWTGKRFLM